MASLHIDDTQASKAERDVVIRILAFIVRPAVHERRGHSAHQTVLVAARCSGDATHQILTSPCALAYASVLASPSSISIAGSKPSKLRAFSIENAEDSVKNLMLRVENGGSRPTLRKASSRIRQARATGPRGRLGGR